MRYLRRSVKSACTNLNKLQANSLYSFQLMRHVQIIEKPVVNANANKACLVPFQKLKSKSSSETREIIACLISTICNTEYMQMTTSYTQREKT